MLLSVDELLSFCVPCICKRELSHVYINILLKLSALPLGTFIKMNMTVQGILNTQLCLSHVQIQ